MSDDGPTFEICCYTFVSEVNLFMSKGFWIRLWVRCTVETTHSGYSQED